MSRPPLYRLVDCSTERFAAATAASWVLASSSRTRKIGEGIFHFLKRGQDGLLIIRHGFIVGGFGLIGNRPPPSGVENGLKRRAANRPKRAGPGQPVR